MVTAGFVCVLMLIVLSHGSLHDDSKSEDNSNDVKNALNVQIIEFFDPNKNIVAHKNEIDGECILKLKNGHAEILNFKNNYDSSVELSNDEMIEIIGENIKNFCKDTAIVFSNNDRPNRSKRSVDKKRYKGQTQTQFVSFGSKNSSHETKNGLAEALSQPDLSRATVSGLNGMGQAQSQSSFGDCDDCLGQDYRTNPTYAGNLQPGNFPLFQPQNQNLRPYGGLETNRQSPGIQYGRNNIGPSFNGQYPNTYPGSGINNQVPGKQDQGYAIGPSANQQYPNTYPGSGINNKVPGKQDQGYAIGPSGNQQYPNTYPVAGTNYLTPGKHDQGYGIGPSTNQQYPNTYPGSGINNKVPGKQDQGYAIGPSANQQYPNSYPVAGTNYLTPGKNDQGYGIGPSAGGQYPNTYPVSGTNNLSPNKQDQEYGIGSSVGRQYPGSMTSNLGPGKHDQGYDIGPSVNQQYPNTYPVSGTSILTPGNQDQGYGIIPSTGGQYPGSGSSNIGPGKQDQGDKSSINVQYPNIHSSLGNNNQFPGNLDHGFGYNSGNEQIPNVANTYTPETKKPESSGVYDQNTYAVSSNPFNPNSWNNNPYNLPNNQQTYPDRSNIPSFNSGSSQGNLAPHNIPNHNVDRQYSINSPQVPVSTLIEHQNRPTNYLPSVITNYPHQNIHGDRDSTKLNLPSLCNFLYQTCLNAVSNNKKLNELQTTNLQNVPTIQPNNIQYPNDGKLFQGIRVPINQQSASYPLYDGKINPNQVRPNIYSQSQDSLGSGGSSIQQPGYTSSGGNVNPNQIQPQGTLGTGESGVQQPGYTSSGGNVNPNQIQPQGIFGTGGSGVQQPGYTTSSGNVNPNQIQPQGIFGTGGSGVQQPGYTTSNGNVNPNQIQPQGIFGTGGSGVQQPGYTTSGKNVNPNQIQPQGTLGTGGSGVQQPGYTSSGGNVNPNQIQPQGTLGTGGSGVQQPGYTTFGGNVNPNQIQPQGTFGTGSGVQQPGYTTSNGNVNPNQIQPQGIFGTGGSSVQQPGYTSSNGNVNPNQIQPQGIFGTGGSSVQQPGYTSSGGNVNPNQIQPQGTLGTGGSGVQQPGYTSSGGNVNPNQIQPQGTFGTGSGVQQPGYTTFGGNVNPNQIQPQGTFGTGGSDVQQPGYTSSGGNVNPNQIQPIYGQPQNAIESGTQPGYGQSGERVNQNGPLSVQSPLDAIVVSGNYPQPYGDNYYRGQQFGPTGNNNPSSNPIIGGQFGTDISSGNVVIPIDTEGGDTQSMTNVNVDGEDTSASASAQGKSKTGMTQTQVSGSYSGTGMFSAQAQTSDSDKGAQSQIISNTNGTTSTAQGKGGKGQSQSQVVYNSESGIALGEAQSSGINYGTNTQLQAGIKGGLADAQSTGPGSTSSQAQIGFLPYESNNNTYQKSIFKGGGTASSQGGSYSGQSQSQLFGSYKHGISYNGAAQASSGKKLQNLPKLNLVDTKLKIGQLEKTNNAVKNQSREPSPLQSIPNILQYITPNESNISIDKTVQNITSTELPTSGPPQESSRNFDIDSEYEENDEYEDEKDEIINTKSVQTKKETSPKQEQNIILNLGNKHDAQITRDSDSQLKTGQVLDAGQIIPGTNGSKIPDGFRGRVASVAGDHTEAKAIPGGQAQTQTVLLTPGAGGLTVVDKTKFRALLSKESYVSPLRSYNGFQTDMNGEMGKFKSDDKNVQYFTKSSTCGYFSFSCNYVNGGKSGAKICKPNPPPFPCQKSN